jgi:hypothetical protein
MADLKTMEWLLSLMKMDTHSMLLQLLKNKMFLAGLSILVRLTILETEMDLAEVTWIMGTYSLVIIKATF